MTYGTKQFKNGKQVGYLEFDSGKKVYLNRKENAEFQNKIRYYQQIAMDTKGDLQLVEVKQY